MSLPDLQTPFGAKVLDRLRTETVIWFTTVGADGTPQPNPVWFLWDDEGFLVFNRSEANRLTHLRHRPRVSLNFDGNGRGGDIVVFTGTARLLPDHPRPHEVPAYLEKYREDMNRISGSPERFGEAYPVALRIDVTRVRGF
ncbi:TIGR03667 family PPOX class F420-dependent oxidoreductase [Amycolatopsis cynarae]|uniref:TIGR03667 family PPOX class F420-dependent oxidoreductase n=1 Tax=Amycolatopsis cynarae TaxID=2995223 RepID=A0ABY7B3H2_9PSEU|nr:TIGR03667 family PPOX class F420-dependent oxidoreductase [Amycolatopsis sp. HUAS 11-8]WAL66859.1 TIGR03667 family PPOX class F420-dependent oxidoreductase [Amycolatopsis sp. HUAS 11-8]